MAYIYTRSVYVLPLVVYMGKSRVYMEYGAVQKTARSLSRLPGTTKRAGVSIFAPTQRIGGWTNGWTEICRTRRFRKDGDSGRISLYWQDGSPCCCCGCRVCRCCDSPHGSSAGCCSTTRRVGHGWSLMPFARNIDGVLCATIALAGAGRVPGKKTTWPSNYSCCAGTPLPKYPHCASVFPGTGSGG